MIDELNEAEIVRGLRRGDRSAWDALCQRYGHRVWGYVARLVGGDEEAVADVFQETMLAVAKAGRGIAEDSKLWAWLARIGHNQCALYWRKRYRERTSRLDADGVEEMREDDPVQALTRRETVQAVRRLLAEMSAEHVALLNAKYLDRLSVLQIVEVMGGTNESVRSRLARARRDFRQRYERLADGKSGAKTSAAPGRSAREGDL